MKNEKKNYLPEMEQIKKWNITVMEFLAKKNPSLKGFCELVKKKFDEYPVQNNKKMLQGYRESYKDINEMTKSIPVTDFNELDKELLSKFGKGLRDMDNDMLLVKIIERGRIISELEYVLVDEKVNTLCQTDSQSPDIEMFNDLLLDFHKKV